MPKHHEYRRNCEIRPGIEFPDGMRRVALGVEYDGSALNGFQKQLSTHNTVQEYLEKALSFVANEPVSIVCAGRTDAGVHGTGQVIHFDTLSVRPVKAWILGGNTKLPGNIRIRWVEDVSPIFHARFRATSRSYRYVISSGPVEYATLGRMVSHVSYDLDAGLMNQAAQHLLGVHDFSSFRASNCQASNPYREVTGIGVSKVGNFVVVDISANAFLYHMVRNIVGALLTIGKGSESPSWLGELLRLKDRNAAPPTAAACGLYLTKVSYPLELLNIDEPIGPYFL